MSIPSTSHDRSERWLLLALAVYFLLVSAFYVDKIVKGRSAVNRWQAQILGGMEEGDNLAQRYNYPNPPIMAILLWPIVKLPPVAAALLWFALKSAMTLLAVVWVFRLVETPERRFPLWAKAAGVVLSLSPITGDLLHGNINLFILFLVIGALTAYRHQRDLLAGLTLGLAIACKVTPALFVPYFLWKRSVKTLIGVAVGLGLFLWPGVVPALVLGAENNREQVTSWYHEMVQPFVIDGKVTTEHHNQSLPGLIYRMTTHNASFSTYDAHDQYQPLAYHNVVDLGPEAARALVKGCMFLFALLVVSSCRTPTLPREGWRLAAEFSVIVLGMLLFSERTWKHHCVTLLLPMTVLTYYLAVCPTRRRGMRGYLIGSLAAATMLMALPWMAPHAGSDIRSQLTFGKLAEVYGAYVWAYLVLLAALATTLRFGERAAVVVAVAPKTAKAA